MNTALDFAKYIFRKLDFFHDRRFYLVIYVCTLEIISFFLP